MNKRVIEAGMVVVLGAVSVAYIASSMNWRQPGSLGFFFGIIPVVLLCIAFVVTLAGKDQ